MNFFVRSQFDRERVHLVAFGQSSVYFFNLSHVFCLFQCTDILLLLLLEQSIHLNFNYEKVHSRYGLQSF